MILGVFPDSLATISTEEESKKVFFRHVRIDILQS